MMAYGENAFWATGGFLASISGHWKKLEAMQNVLIVSISNNTFMIFT